MKLDVHVFASVPLLYPDDAVQKLDRFAKVPEVVGVAQRRNAAGDNNVGSPIPARAAFR